MRTIAYPSESTNNYNIILAHPPQRLQAHLIVAVLRWPIHPRVVAGCCHVGRSFVVPAAPANAPEIRQPYNHA
jgi:hypothetical protein